MFRVLRSCIAALAIGCGAPIATPEPAPTVPPGWTTFETATGDLRVTLPPWLVPHDTENAIYAMDPRGPVVAPRAFHLAAYGPDFAQPIPGQDLAAWLEFMMADDGPGVPVLSTVNLPAGSGIRYERIDRPGMPDEQHVLAFAVEVSSGYAWIKLFAPPEVWRLRAGDVDWIARLLRVR